MYELPRDHPLWGREFDWLGIDRHGHVAVFSNAGYGPLPETVDERLADVDAALERADELAAIGSAANIENSGDGDHSFWYSYSAKGEQCLKPVDLAGKGMDEGVPSRVIES
jgi:hypothetical protein